MAKNQSMNFCYQAKEMKNRKQQHSTQNQKMTQTILKEWPINNLLVD